MEPYIPQELPIKDIDCSRLIKLVGEANGELARFDGLIRTMIHPELLLAPLMTEEAVQSSRIEGTQATLTDVFEYHAGVKKPKNIENDIQEIENYRAAMDYGQSYLAKRPISLFFIRELHRILMESVRGEDKFPGMFRAVQNFIGRPGSSIKSASFIPPSPERLLTDMEAFQRFIENDDQEVLLQTATMHAQFELLHPFLDGDGRVGRLLIPLFLYRKKKLSQPIFYISGYLERNRAVYYERLRGISQERDWNGWFEFFLEAVTSQARMNCRMAMEIFDLYDKMKTRIREATRSQYAMDALDVLFRMPAFSANSFVSEMNMCTRMTANNLLTCLKNHNLIEEVESARGNQSARFIFTDLLDTINEFDGL